MLHKRMKICALLLLGFGLIGLQAQESINATGGDATGNGSVAFSIGQIGYTNFTGTNGSVTQGVQQPYEISVVIGVEKPQIDLTISAYPNPTIDILILRIADFSTSELSYLMYDLNGKLLQRKEITQNQTKIVMSGLLPSTYFVKVIDDNKEVKTFKIIKK